MKRYLAPLALVMIAGAVALTATEADARRFGGGGNSGMQRSQPARQQQAPEPTRQAPQQQAPAQQAAPAAAGATGAAAATAPRRSWLGPVAGIAAGLGLAALFSHLGMGAAVGEFLTLLLLVVAGFFLVRFLMRRFAGPRLQPAGGPAVGSQRMAWAPQAAAPAAASGGGSTGAAALPVADAAPRAALPADFDQAAFERAAKQIFIRLQAANDAGDLDDIRRFTTPEMFAAARLELQERSGARQRTDVVQLNAEVLELAQDDGRDVVSVRYRGLIREDEGGIAQPFDEVWHLVRPSDGSREWAIAGVQQTA